jgi:two-component system, NarL family, response regulator LiaR
MWGVPQMATRLLLADDSETVRGVIRTFLEQCPNLEVCGEADNGLEAVEMAVRLRPDVVVLDVLMPQMNGIEAASILKKRLPHAKTILFTMYGDYVKTLASAAGVHYLVGKPEGMSPLIEAVDAAAKAKHEEGLQGSQS